MRLRFRRHRCADEEVCGRHTLVPAGADVETHGHGAEMRYHGQLGHTGGGSLSSSLLEVNSKRAAAPEHDSRRRNGDAGAQRERQIGHFVIVHVGVFIRQADRHPAALLKIPGEPKRKMGTGLP